MSGLRRQVIANFVGRGWLGLTSIVSAPIFVHFLGVEAYGLIGLFITLFSLSNVLDLGFSASMSRELARSTATSSSLKDERRDLVRTLEAIYWALALLLGLVTVLLAPALATGWLHGSDLPVSTVRNAVVLIGLALTFQWPLSLYAGGLMGLQRQVLLNTIAVVMITIRYVGAIGILWIGPPSIVRFFAWQAAAGALHTFTVVAFLWRSLPGESKPRFRASLLRQTGRFAAGVSATSVLVIVFTQMDKVVLSHILSLKDFGYYSLATVAATGLSFLSLAVFQAVFPHFTVLLARKDDPALRRIYHQSCQFMSAVILPIAAVIVVFSSEVMDVWTGQPDIVHNTHLVVSLLAAGTALNGLVNIPYALQLANSWTSLVLCVNLAAVPVFVPALVLVTRWHGAIGAAWVWLLLNASHLLVVIPLMHRRLLQGEKLRWFSQDILVPLATALAVTLTARLLLPASSSRLVTGGYLLLILGTALAAAGIATPATREWARRLLPGGRRGIQEGSRTP